MLGMGVWPLLVGHFDTRRRDDEMQNTQTSAGFGSLFVTQIQSALVFVPSEVGSDTILPGQIRGFVSNRGTTGDLHLSPSELWPTNATDTSCRILSRTSCPILRMA